VWALASAFNVPVIPHSQQAHNAHLIIAHINSPLIEVFPTAASHRTGYTLFTELFDGEPEASGGWIELSDAPGLGISLNEDALAEHAVSAETSR
jgi:L-alanine-DL-glutamate epimerase-like enolase superfamily enzyme